MFYIWREGLDVRNFCLKTCWAYFQSNPSFDSCWSCCSCRTNGFRPKTLWRKIGLSVWSIPRQKLVCTVICTVMYRTYATQPQKNRRNDVPFHVICAFYADQANYKNAHLMRITKCMLFHAYQRI